MTDLEQTRRIADAYLRSGARTAEISQFPVSALQARNGGRCLRSTGRSDQDYRGDTHENRLDSVTVTHMHS